MARKPVNPLTSVFVVGAVDMFKETHAPYHMEERVRGFGRPYQVKVYEPEAYTARHMAKSDESKCLVRWVVKLSNGMKVSRDGVMRLRAPEAWDRLRPYVAKLRGEKKEQAMASALWEAITPEEREAMVASVDLASYVEGRAPHEALEDLYADLVESKSPLAHVDAGWSRRMHREFVRAAFGTPDPAWNKVTWPEFVRFNAILSGHTHDQSAYGVYLDPRTMPLTILTRNGRDAAPSWVMSGGLSSFVETAHPALAEDVFRVVEARLGGPPQAGETEPFPLQGDIEMRRTQNAIRDARRARLTPADHGAGGFLYHNKHTFESGWLWDMARMAVRLRERRGWPRG